MISFLYPYAILLIGTNMYYAEPIEKYPLRIIRSSTRPCITRSIQSESTKTFPTLNKVIKIICCT